MFLQVLDPTRRRNRQAALVIDIQAKFKYNQFQFVGLMRVYAESPPAVGNYLVSARTPMAHV
jgi:hypothetical protein